jgi:hypothetical protein
LLSKEGTAGSEFADSGLEVHETCHRHLPGQKK